MDRERQEQQAALRAEALARLGDDPWWSWRPLPRQEPFITAVLGEGAREVWFIAANRSGKSDVASYCGAGFARFGRSNPKWQTRTEAFRPTKGWVISATGGSSRTIIQPKYFNNGMGQVESHMPFIPPREIKSWNVNDQTLVLKNGSIIEFKSAEAKAITFAGAGLDWIHIDEECPKNIYDELVIRVGGDRRLTIFGACTLLPPEGQVGGVSWMFGEKIKPWLANPQAVDFQIFGSSIYDNPHILPEEVKRLESRYPVGSVERAIRLDGEYLPGMQGTRAYGSFDARIHVRPQPELVIRKPVVWSMDFNVDPMISHICQRDGTLFRVHKELVLEGGDGIPEMVQMFHEAVPAHHGEVWIYGDATGKSRSGQTGRSYYHLITNLMRTYGSPLRLKVPEANPHVPDRINAVNRALKDEQGQANVEIDPSCKELVDDFEQVLRDNRGGIKKSHNRRDPYSRRTHASDGVGYWIAYESPVRVATIGERITRIIRNPAYGFRA